MDTATPSATAASQSLIEQIIQRASGAAPRTGNHIELLLDSTENFPEWEAALSQAQTSICIEMYIIAGDAFGRRIRQILLDRLASGVAVVLIYDWLGSLNARLKGFFQPLVNAGAQVYAYNPPNWLSGLGILSRNHRKSIIIDEQTAFVSGLCMSASWCGQPEKGISPWRDTGLKLQGPIVQDILAAFLDTLHAVGGHTPAQIYDYEPGESELAGNAAGRVLATTPANINTMRLDLNLIGLATQNLWITDAYFMPAKVYVQALINAAQAGVDVRILVPRTSDIKWIGTVSRTQYRQLLDAGVRVFEWNGPMIHAKSALIDGEWARVGSTNLNFSSWYANRELDISIEDPATVYLLERIFLRDLECATEVVLNERSGAELQQKRDRTLQNRQIRPRTQIKGVMRQVMRLSRAFDSSIVQTRQVGESEAWAYVSIGAVLLLGAALLWFAPQILIWPLLFLLIIGGISTMVQALLQLRRLHKK